MDQLQPLLPPLTSSFKELYRGLNRLLCAGDNFIHSDIVSQSNILTHRD